MVFLLAQHKELESVTLSNARSPCNSKSFLVQVMINQIFNKTDAALCRTRHFDKWCSQSSLHQGHSKALRLVAFSWWFQTCTKYQYRTNTRLFTTYLHHNLPFLRKDFFNCDFSQPSAGLKKIWRIWHWICAAAAQFCWLDTGLCQEHIHTMVIFGLSEWEMSGQCTKQLLTVMK